MTLSITISSLHYLSQYACTLSKSCWKMYMKALRQKIICFMWISARIDISVCSHLEALISSMEKSAWCQACSRVTWHNFVKKQNSKDGCRVCPRGPMTIDRSSCHTFEFRDFLIISCPFYQWISHCLCKCQLAKAINSAEMIVCTNLAQERYGSHLFLSISSIVALSFCL